jgi:hypothetical protein
LDRGEISEILLKQPVLKKIGILIYVATWSQANNRQKHAGPKDSTPGGSGKG